MHSYFKKRTNKLTKKRVNLEIRDKIMMPRGVSIEDVAEALGALNFFLVDRSVDHVIMRCEKPFGIATVIEIKGLVSVHLVQEDQGSNQSKL